MSPVNYDLLRREEERRARELASRPPEVEPEPQPEAPHFPYKPRAAPGTWSYELRAEIGGVIYARQMLEAAEARLARQIKRGQRAGATLRQIASMCGDAGLLMSKTTVANILARVSGRR